MRVSRKKAGKLKNEFGKLKDDFFDFDKISSYFRGSNHPDAFQVIPDRTFEDLNFNEIFKFLDRTVSRPGQQYLYKTLRVIHTGKAHHEKREKLIEYFTANEEERIKVQALLSRLDRGNAYYIAALFQDEQIKPPGWFIIMKLLAFLSVSLLVFMPFFPRLFFLFLPVFTTNLIIHYWNKQNLYQYVGSLPQLLRLSNISRVLLKFDIFSDRKADIPASLQVIDRLKAKMSLFRLEARMDSDMAAIVWFAVELIKIAFLLEPLILFNILKRLESTRAHIHNLFSFIGEADMTISIASLRKGLPRYCHPEITRSGKFMDLREVYHPLIIDCVSNSLLLKDKSMLITGSNMSGKTTFIRTIGLNVITGMAINTCFADQFEFPLLRIHSAIRITDDLLNDKSYYFEEVLTIREMIRENGDVNLFLLDEIYKGTNTVERIAAGKAVLSKLNDGNNFVFVSTHDIELADLLADEYDLYNFSEVVDEKTIGFDYKLKPGKLKTRNAISILEINEYPEDVVNEAKALAARMDEINRTRKLTE